MNDKDNMTVKKIWLEDTYVRSSETDFLAYWKISGFISAMIEAASHHAEHLGVGYQDMMARETAWVISRLKIRFHNYPRLQDPVTIQTWPKGIQQKIFFMRDYIVSAKDGSRLASATSAYILVNPRVRRLLPPQSLNIPIPDNSGLNALDETLDKLLAPRLLEEQFVVRADYSTVDLLSHVNNVRYIDWIGDCFNFDEHRASRPSWLQINYLNEVLPGESVVLKRGIYDDHSETWFVTGVNLSTGANAFEAQIGWRSI